MTHVNGSRRIRREVTTVRGTALVIELAPEGLWLREKRRRTAYLLPYGEGYIHAATLYADAQRRAKARARRERRGSR